jgi:hypothetical protein
MYPKTEKGEKCQVQFHDMVVMTHKPHSPHVHTEREKVRLGSRQGVSSSFSNSSKKYHFTTQ